MRVVVLLALAALVAGCGDEDESAGSGSTQPATAEAELEISVWRRGSDGPVRTYTLRCPGDDRCAQLAELEDAFVPVPDDVACTEIYGGPEVAEIRGTYRGRQVLARFRRTDGCEIARWDKHAFLFPTS